MHTFLLLKALITRIGLVYLPQDIKIPNQVQEKHYPNFSTWRENLIDVWEFLMRNGSVTNSDYFSRNLATLGNWVTLMWPSSPILGWLTVWKFHDFSITQILRDINFWILEFQKFAIFTHSEALNFDFHEFLHLLKAETYQIAQFRAPKMAKTAG